MKATKALFHLLLIFSVLFTLIYFTSEVLGLGLAFPDAVLLLISALAINIISIVFILKGLKSNSMNTTALSLAVIGIKMGLYLILILIFYLLSKISGTKFIITFFVIYLTFTAYLIRFLVKTLNINKIR